MLAEPRMSIIAVFLHIQHPRGPPEATVPPTSRYGPRIENRPSAPLLSGGTGAAPGGPPERPGATEILRMALFRSVPAVLALRSTYKGHLSPFPSSVFLAGGPP